MPFRLLIALALATSLAGPATAAELYGTLKKVKESGEIVLGYREASYPFSFVDEEGKPAGYSVDLCRVIASGVKEELGLESLEIVFKPVTAKNRIPAVVDGEIDIECGSTTNTLTRQERVDFTHITFVTGAKLLVKADSGISDFGGLAGKTLALVAGTTTEEGVNRVLERTKIDAKVLVVADHDEGFTALKEGRADAYISDHILLYGLAQKDAAPQSFRVVGQFLSYEPYGLMLRRDDSAFRLVANRTLSALFRDDRISLIFQTWFEPMGASPGELLRAAVALQTFPE